MKQPSLWKKFCQSMQYMRLTDLCLVVFLILLLSQSAYHFFFYDTSRVVDSSMDTMIRSSAATIFGYFISAGFGNHVKTDKNAPDMVPLSDASAKTDLSSRQKNTDTPVEPAGTSSSISPYQACRIRQQIWIVGGIGLFSLLLLSYVHIFVPPQAYAVPSLSQFQDFLVGSIGFLVGHAKYDV